MTIEDHYMFVKHFPNSCIAFFLLMASSLTMMASAPTCMLLTLGDELLNGIRENGHLQYLGQQLADEGMVVKGNIVARDQLDEMVEAFQYCWERADVVITTGGLGPTVDDSTREGIAQALGISLVWDASIEEAINEWLKPLQRTIPENSKKQCYKLNGAEVLPNAHGTAPGQFLKKDDKYLVMLPGPANELVPMFQKYTLPKLREALALPGRRDYIQIRTVGVPEAMIADKLDGLLKKYQALQLGYCVHYNVVDVRLSLSTGYDEAKLEVIAQECKTLLGDDFFAFGDISLEKAVVDKLLQKSQTLAVAESCSGGLLAGALTSISGISGVFKGGVVSYQDEVKHQFLHVSEEILQGPGAVSAPAAEAMAQGVREAFGTDYAISVTGYAGPTGGTEEDPVGTVYIGLSTAEGCHVERYFFPGDRQTVKVKAVNAGVYLLWRTVGSC